MAPKRAPGLIIAAPASGSGKTFVTLALLRTLRDRGVRVSSVKAGPDYIDPAFHRAASGRTCFNLDSWAMAPATMAGIVARAETASDLIIAEGVMGLFDGATGGGGSSADLAVLTDWPVVLVVNAAGMGASAAALVEGFARHRPEVSLAAVVFNGVASPRHAAILRSACDVTGVPVAGAIPKAAALRLPSRHLGLVQACEHPDLEAFLAQAAAHVAGHLDPEAFLALARPSRLAAPEAATSRPAFILGQRTAVARDTAFAFAYPHLLQAWRSAGVELSFFSPLEDQAPPSACDSIYLPGGYPELHAARLAANLRYQSGLRAAAAAGHIIYGECGGFMALGTSLEDADGQTHPMAGLLPLKTSFRQRQRQLGYRQARLLNEGPFGPAGQAYRGHEFHYACELGDQGQALSNRCEALFSVTDAQGHPLPPMGQRVGTVMGSFLHVIDQTGGQQP